MPASLLPKGLCTAECPGDLPSSFTHLPFVLLTLFLPSTEMQPHFLIEACPDSTLPLQDVFVTHFSSRVSIFFTALSYVTISLFLKSLSTNDL